MILKLRDKNGLRLFLKDSIVTENIDVVPELQKLTVTENNRTYTSDEGYVGIGEITVNITNTTQEITTEEVTATPSDETQVILPTNANYISKVTVNPIPDDYVPDGYVPEGTVPSGYIKPSGTKIVNTNETHNVKEYEFVTVEVPTGDGGSSGEGGSSGGGSGIDYEGETTLNTQEKIYIDGVIYSAEEYMTWAEWLDSEHNTLGLGLVEIDSIPYISALNSGMFLVQFLTLMPTLATDVIALGGMYALVPAESLSSNAAYAVSDVMTKEEKIDLMIRKFGINKKGGEANG